VTGHYAAMSDMELVGHVGAIPDASELSQALAVRVRLLATERDKLQRELDKTKISLLSFELGLAQDRIAGFMEATKPAPRKPQG